MVCISFLKSVTAAIECLNSKHRAVFRASGRFVLRGFAAAVGWGLGLVVRVKFSGKFLVGLFCEMFWALA